MFKNISKGFDQDPASSALHSSDMKEKQSDTSKDLRDKNTKMMDDLKEKMERNKRF
ncbi:MAG: hypothetical protein HQL16_04635 [Candidatus Omnitrophica bacterium]|nr:hypothetical protein [Candidatus Omnitrophota bacterium]